MSFPTSGLCWQVAARVTCPAEAQVVGDVGQPLLHPLLRILLICTRSRTEWPWLSVLGEDPALTIHRGSHLSKQSMVAPSRYYPYITRVCVPGFWNGMGGSLRHHGNHVLPISSIKTSPCTNSEAVISSQHHTPLPDGPREHCPPGNDHLPCQMPASSELGHRRGGMGGASPRSGHTGPSHPRVTGD